MNNDIALLRCQSLKVASVSSISATITAMKLPKRFDLLEPSVPLVFTDGTKVYDDLAKRYKRHRQGYFILAPSGAGKTHFISLQAEKHWLDGDELWMLTKAHPEGEWWLEGLDVIKQIESRSDVITDEARKLGFWVIGSSNVFLKPDAIVIPNWRTHKRWVAKRQAGDYDGGATTDQLAGLLRHRKVIARWEKQGVPRFKSVEEAASYLAAK